jgi:hypothetical protein
MCRLWAYSYDTLFPNVPTLGSIRLEWVYSVDVIGVVCRVIVAFYGALLDINFMLLILWMRAAHSAVDNSSPFRRGAMRAVGSSEICNTSLALSWDLGVDEDIFMIVRASISK